MDATRVSAAPVEPRDVPWTTLCPVTMHRYVSCRGPERYGHGAFCMKGTHNCSNESSKCGLLSPRGRRLQNVFSQRSGLCPRRTGIRQQL
eukprot:5911240-Prymnesium_polylepis.2